MDVKRFLLAGSSQSLLTYTFYILTSKSEHRWIHGIARVLVCWSSYFFSQVASPGPLGLGLQCRVGYQLFVDLSHLT